MITMFKTLTVQLNTVAEPCDCFGPPCGFMHYGPAGATFYLDGVEVTEKEASDYYDKYLARPYDSE